MADNSAQPLELKDLLVRNRWGNDPVIKQFKERMTTDGWAFVTLPKDLQKLVKAATKPLKDFFTRDIEVKRRCHDNFQGTTELDGPVYGFNQTETKTKEGLRLLTGGRLKEHWVPAECSSTLLPLIAAVDSIMLRFMETTTNVVFGIEFEELASKFDIPLLAGAKKDKAKPMTQENFAMFDVAYYPNQKPTVDNLNVAGHYDPGLFSLSFLSTHVGLQVRKADGTWIDCPTAPNLGIIWAGQLAEMVSKDIKPGWHRVKHDPNKVPRLSAWVEVCTRAQDLSYSKAILENVKFPNAGLFYLPGKFLHRRFSYLSM